MEYKASVPFATERLALDPKTIRLIDRDLVLYSHITNATTKASKALEDVDDENDGFQVDLAVGKNLFEITVANGKEGSLPQLRTYTVNVEWEFFAFNDPNKDIDLNSNNSDPRGIWSDGTNMWVADSEDGKLYTYNMWTNSLAGVKLTGAAMPPMDIPLVEANANPQWIWSDGAIMWVSDTEDNKIYAYNMSDKTRNESREINLAALSEANDSPQGLWSDGENLWVANGTTGNVKLYAYKLAGERIDCREETKDFNTLEDAGEPTGDGNLHPKAIFSDGVTMYVVDSDDGKIYAYNQPLSDNASLRRVELSDVYHADKTFNDYFQTARRLDFYPHAYVLYSTNATTTIRNIETQDPRVNREKQGDDLLGWKIQSPADADSAVDGHQVRLTAGDTTEITILVTAQSGATREHIIRIANDPSGPLPFRDFNHILADGNREIPGLWGDGTTMWTTAEGGTLHAYKMDANDWGALDVDKRGQLNRTNAFSRGLWGNEITMWVANASPFPFLS